MAMSRRDYEALAAMVAGMVEEHGMAPRIDAEDLAHKLADVCDKGGNARFDRGQFLKACGVEG